MDERGCLINCCSLEGQLAKLEVLGLRAFKHLQKILHPFTCPSKNSCQSSEHSPAECGNYSQFKKPSGLENEDNIGSHAILSLRVYDPRILPETRAADVPGSPTTGTLRVLKAEAKECAALAGISDKNKELPKLEGTFISHSNDNLWDISRGISPPVEESVLCMQRHHLRMDDFCLDVPNSGMLSTSTTHCSRSCPILLLKNNYQKGSLIGWSILLPLSWVKAFWAPLVSMGAHAIGLREKHWIACEMGLPFFPSDFPDCNAYSCFMGTEAAAFNKKLECCRLDVKPWKVPIVPPWDTVRLAFDKGPTRVGNGKAYNEEHMDERNSLSESSSGNCHISSSVHLGNSFDGVVARTHFELTDFLREIQGDLLLLFPQQAENKTSIFKIMKDESLFSLRQNDIGQFSRECKLCFLRILLHAYKEGVFEEGAVICAPQLSDISLLLSRPGHGEGGLQMPQSAVKSYFKEQSSAKWELQIPEAVAKESHRWPIGFVTTGFVRGSKKPVAVALCEAVLLARLREEQWRDMPTKRRKEIYVLVRNLRSSSYRLALATIVLEQHEDVEFI
ncbi:Ribonucleases P/MRP protein subunit POP1 [Morella rubra]|uniref:Ribonucleases P/MRP protein subunit POP1 n=1 Tax=Morella rubra TaxID=262757 RepID=A0A6A1WJV7_9ROSI|nr:Ribonucleases P/MRP protein subunit POP1 [Morella rubra]